MTDETKDINVSQGRDTGGKFGKGNSFAAGPRSASSKKKAKQQEVLNEILHEADGDAVKVKELMLKRGSELELDFNTALRLARELAPYQAPKKASIETKNENISTYVIVENTPSSLPNVTPDLIEEDKDDGR